MGTRKINANARWNYNGKDCIATIGALNVLSEYLTPETRMVYKAEMALEACTLAIQSRGIKIDIQVRKDLLRMLRKRFSAVCVELNEAAGYAVNPNSPMQVKELFYGTLGLKECKNKDDKVTVDVNTLERIAKSRVSLAEGRKPENKKEHLEHCAELAKLVLKARSVNKDAGMVKARLDGGRMRTSINVGATESFRFSASKTHFGAGANLQQVKHDLRGMFIPDDGMVMVYMDQNRAESFVVAHLSADPAYIAAHAAADTHVEVAKLIWPDAGWTGDPDADLELSEQPNFIRLHSRRDLAKRTQHALNYYPPPDKEWHMKGSGPQHTLARLLGIEVRTAYQIANSYFEAFPGIRKWQDEIIEQVKKYQRVYYPGGFYRDFFGRPWDEGTHREAISSIPQSTVAWTNHIVMFRLWKELEKEKKFEMLMHNHDAVLFQCTDWDLWRPRVEALSVVEWPWEGGTFSVPWDGKAGKNWKEAS